MNNNFTCIKVRSSSLHIVYKPLQKWALGAVLLPTGRCEVRSALAQILEFRGESERAQSACFHTHQERRKSGVLGIVHTRKLQQSSNLGKFVARSAIPYVRTGNEGRIHFDTHTFIFITLSEILVTTQQSHPTIIFER